jgi:hypothetical protein
MNTSAIHNNGQSALTDSLLKEQKQTMELPKAETSGDQQGTTNLE